MAKVGRPGIPQITPEEMLLQISRMPHQLDLNIWNFEAGAGKAAVKVFRHSFDLERLNATNSTRWRQRKRNYAHPMLDETGLMKNSLKWERKSEDIKSVEHGVTIYSDPKDFVNARRQRHFYHYAIVHNNGDVGSNVPVRPFMGDSDVLERTLNKLVTEKLFVGLP